MPTGRVRRIGLSPTLRVSGLAEEMRAAGVDVVDFSAGQPDFPTPDAVKRAGIESIEQDRTRYTANAGMPELREAIVERIRREHGLAYRVADTIVSPGAKASLYFAMLALIEEGDEALIPAPYWVSYPEQVRLAGGEPVFVPCSGENGFRLDPERLRKSLTPRTRLLVLNDPGNPSGASYSADELRPIAELCVEAGLWILSDEIYSRLLYDGRTFTSIATLGDEVRARTVMIDGMSKAWSMTGWRVGWAAGPSEVISAMGKLQSHVTSNVTTPSQYASVAALRGSDDEIRRRLQVFQRRRDRIVKRLRALDGVRCTRPEGAFYVLPDWSERLGSLAAAGIRDGVELAERLLRDAHVAVVPGEAFGAPGHLRFSYAISEERIDEGMDRIERALRSIG